VFALPLVLLLSTDLGAVGLAVLEHGHATCRWSTLAPMNAPHEYHAAVTVAGKVYAVGGTRSVTLEE
jgi:hypothetical protein